MENPDEHMIKLRENQIIPNEEYYTPWMKIIAEQQGTFTVEPEIELYKWEPSTEEIIYETSFEDNARNYMEWSQIDGDCNAPGGYYDSWAWSDNRACHSEHSFKSTMYNEYKNMQEDYLYLKDAIDISNNYAVNITFDTYVAGEYTIWYKDSNESNLYNPLDYLTFGIIADDTMYHVNNEDGQVFTNSSGNILPGNYYFFDTSIPLFNPEGTNTYGHPNPMDYTKKATTIQGCPGWWHVWIQLPVSSLPSTDIGVWFKWTTDKERVHEGAYVDNIQIKTIAAQGEKIYQGHSQEWLNLNETTFFEFPLKWNDVEPGNYKAVIKLKNDDEDQYDINQEIFFSIGDQIDCEITDLRLTDDFSGEEITETIEFNTDLHADFTMHNNGNIPIENVSVKATAYKQKKEIIYKETMESTIPEIITLSDGSLPHASNDFAWSGSTSLAFNNPNSHHYGNESSIGGLINNPINMEHVQNAYLDHYVMGKLGNGDQFITVFASETSHYVYQGDIIIDSNTKTDPWTGPMQPQSTYQQINLQKYWSILEQLNENLNENGQPIYTMYIGYILQNNEDNSIFYQQEYNWSGAYLDDVTVTAQKRDTVAWTDTQIISGPCEPCETCNVEFTWKDVPTCCYDLVVETMCPQDINTKNDKMNQSFCVLEKLEKMGKADYIDYTTCNPEAWCISDVTGNSCGNNGQGDRYALATNCDTYQVPIGVNDYITLGPGDECHGIDISHIDLFIPPPPPPLFFDFESGNQGWTVVDGDGNPANWELGSTMPGPCEEGGATGQWFYIDDDAAGSGAGPSTDNWLISPDLSSVSEVSFHGDFQDMAGDGELTVKASADGGITWSDAAIFTNDMMPGGFEAYFDSNPSISLPTDTDKVAFHYSDDSSWAWGALIDNVEFETFPLVSTDIIFETGFEKTPWDKAFADNTGWLNSLYGTPCEGTAWAYSWAAGDALTTPTVTFQDETTISFQNKAESSTIPVDLEVWLDYGSADEELLWSDYGYTHNNCEVNTISLGESYAGDHTITWLGLSSTFYGQILDDILVTTESEPQFDYDLMWFNATYQCDLSEPAKVVLEIADAKTGECGDFTLKGTDEYGDGWDSNYDSINDAFIDVIVNGEEIITDFTVSSSSNSETFSVCDGDDIQIIYTSLAGIYESEHAWQLLDANNYVLAEDGENGTEPAIGVTEVSAQISSGVCEGCEPMDCACPPGTIAWKTVKEFTNNAPGVCQEISVLLNEFIDYDSDTLCIRLRLDTTESTTIPGIGFHLHEYSITNLLYNEVTEIQSDYYEDWEDGILDHEPKCVTYGKYWQQNETNGNRFSQVWPAEPVHNGLIWDTEIEDAYAAWFFGEWEYHLGLNAELRVEMSADGGENWFILAREHGPKSTGRSPIPCTANGFDLTPWAGKSLLFRVVVDDPDGKGGYVIVNDFAIHGKRDRKPPTVQISLSGNSVSPRVYAGPVTVSITGTDDNAVGSIHYIFDGSETTVAGSSTSFFVPDDGEHSVEYWAVDSTGNEGIHNMVTFRIDNTPPTIEITRPDPGLYLFDNKILNFSMPIIIGAFTAEAIADDAQGVAVVQFFLRGEIIGEDTQTPFDTYVAVKNMDLAEFKVTAVDGVGNTAEETIDITYYKFL
jgi:hypothetical protein